MVQIITVNDKEVRHLFGEIRKLPEDIERTSRQIANRLAMAITSRAAGVGFNIKANSYKSGGSNYVVSIPRYGLALDGDVGPFKDASKKAGWWVPIRGSNTKLKARKWWIKNRGIKDMPRMFFLYTRPFIRSPTSRAIAQMDGELRRTVDRRVR